MTREERIAELKLQYDEFITTKDGKDWIEDCKNRNNGLVGDFGDYLYDFYTEMLM